MTFNKTKVIVHNRGSAPNDFLRTLVEWAKRTPDEFFSVARVDDEPNIFDYNYADGPHDITSFTNVENRKAFICEVFRVLAGFESSWDWECDYDVTNPTENTPYRKSAGIFQISPNIMYGRPLLQNYYNDVFTGDEWAFNDHHYRNFRKQIKRYKWFALTLCLFVLRHTVRHHGPILRKEIYPWLNKESFLEFKGLITNQQDEINMSSDNKKIWVIDPGHGGHDSGAVSEGVKEKDIVLRVGKELKRILEKDKRFKVFMTRGDDSFVPLTGRANIANTVGGNLLSIHCNKYNGSGNGLEGFTSRGVTKSDAIATALIEEYAKGFEGDLKLRSDFSDGDIDKEAGFTVLTKTRNSAVLMELGFIDNEGDRMVMTDPGFVHKAAMSLYKGLLRAEGLEPMAVEPEFDDTIPEGVEGAETECSCVEKLRNEVERIKEKVVNNEYDDWDEFVDAVNCVEPYERAIKFLKK